MSDPTAEERKKDHIELALKSQADTLANDPRFYYEPMLGIHPENSIWETDFLQWKLNLPLWISSMTGGTAMAGTINRNLAAACSEFGIGMGLGSCRALLESNEYFDDFNLRPVIGNSLPFFANLGIAQVEKLVNKKETGKIADLVDKLKADGLIIHVNPLQEWLQPEGDRFTVPPIETIGSVLNDQPFPVIVKEVGQGMGPESIRALLALPIAAFDFGAYGGTNFSKLELLRSQEDKHAYAEVIRVGHTAEEMVQFVNAIVSSSPGTVKCRQVIISGGIRNFMDGYYYINKIKMQAVYAQGSAFLKVAQHSYDALKAYIQSQAEGLALCRSYLKVK